MSRKISEFFHKVDETEKLKIDGNFSSTEPKIRKCRVILKDIKDEIKNGRFKNFKVVGSESDLKLQDVSNSVNRENPSNYKTKYKCMFCENKLSTKCNLARHSKNVHPNEIRKKLFVCQICELKFIQKWAFDKHMKVKHFDGKIQRFECDFDGKIFKTKGYLKMHMRSHLPTVKCEICQAEYKQGSIYVHLKEFHATERKFQCKICSKSFKSKNSLKQHENVHDKKFKCSTCDRTFQNKYLLKQHIKVKHENTKSFVCEKCNKKFNQEKTLERHQKIHEKNRPKPFKCQRCDYATDQESRLESHMKSHQRQDEKFAAVKNPLKCGKCPKLYRNKQALRSHLWSVHPKDSFQCDLCGKYFKTKRCTYLHIKFHLKSMHR